MSDASLSTRDVEAHPDYGTRAIPSEEGKKTDKLLDSHTECVPCLTPHTRTKLTATRF